MRRRFITLMANQGGDTTAPSVSTFTATSPSTSLNIPITAFTASEAGVYFIITESSTPPAVDAAGWNLTAQTTYTVSANGTYTLYPWVKDASDNISSVYGSPATVVVIVYLLKDLFTTDDDAPMTTPRTCEPTGTLTVVDTTNLMSITGSKLVWTGRNAAADPMVQTATALYARTIGLALSVKTDGTKEGSFKLSPTATTGAIETHDGFYFTGSTLRLADAGLIVNGPNTGVNPHYLICRTNGFMLIQDVAGTKTLLFVYYRTTQSLATNLYAIAGVLNNNSAGEADNLYVCQLPAPYATDTGSATASSASPASGTELTHEANCHVEVEWVATTGATKELNLRRTDDDNRWIVRCDQGGSTIKLIERNAGVETERSSAAQTWTNATKYRIYVIAYGNNIYTYTATSSVRDTQKNSYTSATFNNTATNAKVTATAGALTNFITWPRTLSGTALSILQAAFP
jgi:hypothetical protein